MATPAFAPPDCRFGERSSFDMLWNTYVGPLFVVRQINDVLMTSFSVLIGLEIKRVV